MLKFSTFALIVLFQFSMLFQSYCQKPSPKCLNYYSPSNPPLQCSGTTCLFETGLQQLAVNKTASSGFVLCLDLPNYNVSISIVNSTDIFLEEIQSLYIYANSVQMLSNYSLLCQNYLVIIADTSVAFIDISLTGSKIYVISEQNIIINGSNFINQSVIPSQCSCVTQKTNCSWNFSYPYLFENQDIFNISTAFSGQNFNYTSTPNNSISLIALSNLQINNTQIKYSIIGIFSQNITITSSIVTSSGLGYPSDSGPGCGYFDEVLNQLLGCMGSGGSHGGFGGNSSPQNCYLLVSRLPYDDLRFPIEPGSGGGFFLPHSRQSSSGGGVINLQGALITLANSSVLAQGRNGIQGGGGGAGGSISLDYNKISGLNVIISANGGNGDKVSSSGSGGRIRLWNHMWKTENLTNSIMKITVSGGQGCRTSGNDNINLTIQLSCGQTGSVFTSPCRPGTELKLPSYICSKCVEGEYQLTYGYAPCVLCTSKPINSQWVQNQQQNGQIIYYQNSCKFVCNQGYILYEGQCLTPVEAFLQRIYATNIFISLGMVGIAVLIYVIIRVIRRLAQQERILSFDNPALNELYKKKFFRLEELPYHEMRLYVSGQNHPFNPWRISQQAQNSLYTEIKSPITRISHILGRVIREINKKGQYSRWQKLLITALRYTYYPLSRIVLSSMRKKKAREIFEEVDKFNKKIPDFQSLGVKFHVKPQQTIASLQIFNYTKSVLDFYIQNYFPLYILLEKAPFDGYIIDFTDPFFKVFINEIVQKETTGKSIENFLKQTNKFLKNPAGVLSCLNHLWTLSDINTKFQAFLWQPTTKILGIDRNYKIDKKQPLFLVFSSENMNNNHFLMNQSLPAAYLPEIQCLKHKFIIRKQLASEQHGNSICLINNTFAPKTLFWMLGILSTLFLLLGVATLFLTILILAQISGCVPSGWVSFNYGFVIYFGLWPLCDFAASFYNFKTILSKNQCLLADAISFNIFCGIKSIILFIGVLVTYPNFDESCLQANEFIWLAMVLLGVAIFIVQVMLRIRIIQQTK